MHMEYLKTGTPGVRGSIREAEDRGPWTGWHLFLEPRNGSPWRTRIDRLLVETVAPLLAGWRSEGWIDRYFFIRYSKLGHHLRLRLAIAPRHRRQVAAALLESLACGALETDEQGAAYRSSHPLISYLRPVDYEPEWVRYGGADGVALAEELFWASSELTLALLQGAAAQDHDARCAQAVLAMTVLLKALAEDRAQAGELARRYAEFALELLRRGSLAEQLDDWPAAFDAAYRRQAPALQGAVDKVWNALVAGDRIPEPFAAYHRRLAAIRHRLRSRLAAGTLGTSERPFEQWRDAVGYLTGSYLHMGNNRLGIEVVEECYLGHLTALLLAPQQDDPSTITPTKGDDR